MLLATGAAVGAAGALVARRRTRAKWAEYEPSSLSADASSFRDAGATSKNLGDKPKSAAHDVTDGEIEAGKIGKATTWTKDHTKSTVDTIRHKIHEATADHDDAGSTVDRMADKANEGAGHMADKAEAKFNDASSRAGSPQSNAGAKAGDSATRAASRVDDEVDDLIRSAKNGRM